MAGVSPDIPWHVTAFHKDYRMNDPENTTPEMLVRAADIGRRNGLRYVYAGNLPGRVGDLENTRCHHCRAMLVERYGYFIQRYRLTPDGCVPGLRDADSRALGRSVRRADHVDAVSARDAQAADDLKPGRPAEAGRHRCGDATDLRPQRIGDEKPKTT